MKTPVLRWPICTLSTDNTPPLSRYSPLPPKDRPRMTLSITVLVPPLCRKVPVPESPIHWLAALRVPADMETVPLWF